MKQYILTLISTLLLLSSCSLIDDLLPACQEEADPAIMISFQMVTAPSLTDSRSDSQGHDEVGSEYEYFEDGIDVNDLGVFVFAKIKDSAGPEQLVFKTTDIKNTSQLTVVGSPGSYVVNMTILRAQLFDAIGVYADPNSADDITFRIMILANCSSPGTNAQAKWNLITKETFTEVVTQLNYWNFAMSYIYNADGGDDVTHLYKNKKEFMPMFGTQTFNVTQNALYYSRPDNVVYLGDIEMLRSLAKVRVVDNIQNKTAAGYPKISAVTFKGSQSSAHQLPYNAVNYVNGTQVHTPYIADANNTGFITGGEFRLGLVNDNWLSPTVTKTGDVRIGFVPEQKIGTNNNVDGTGCPMFTITVASFLNDDGTEDTIDYDVRMNDFPDFGQNILRNHIYTLSVDLKDSHLDCIVDLVPYIGVTLEPEFGFDWLYPPQEPEPTPAD